MKKYHSILGIFLIFSLVSVGFNPFNSTNIYQSNPKPITVSGPLSGDCKGVFSFSFYPAGGPVNGSMNCVSKEFDSAGTIVKTQIITVNLSGTFQGGDGGVIIGTMSGQARAICPICTEPDITASINGQPWEGFLYANGTGNGNMLRNTRTGAMVTWSVTFSAQQFQEGLGNPASPTFDTTQSNLPETQQKAEIPASPTVGSTQTNPTQPIPVLTSIQAAIQAWPTVEIAAEEILNQDGAIIARDDKGVFYVVSNEGVRKPLPEELQDRVSQDLFFLWNADLLNASPAIKALVAMDTIGSTEDITGANKYFEIPPWLKEHDYMKLNTKCADDTCGSELSMPAMLGTSWELDKSYFPQEVLASSEHSSVRGTINGGGDFISTPKQPQEIWLASLLFAIQPRLVSDPVNRPYLGAHTNINNNQEIIRLVQKGSPAEKAGLAIGDVVLMVDKIAVEANKPLASVISQHHGGDQVELEITRNGNPMAFTIKLAQISPPKITTSAAEITLSDNTRLVIDTGFNGVNGIYVREGQVHVREPISGSEVDVQAGQAVIVVPGYPIEAPITLSNDQIHDSFAKSSQANSTETTIEFPLWYLIVFVAVIIILIVVIVVFLRRKGKPSKEENTRKISE